MHHPTLEGYTRLYFPMVDDTHMRVATAFFSHVLHSVVRRGLTGLCRGKFAMRITFEDSLLAEVSHDETN